MLTARGGARLGIGAACVIFVASLGVLASHAADARRNERASSALRIAAPGTSAPDFVLTDARDGRSVHLSDLRGSTVVLCFTSIRCPVSNDCNPRVAALARQYASRTTRADGKAVRFLAVHCDLGTGPLADEDRREIPVQTRVAGLDFPQLLDNDGAVARRFAVDRTPTYLLIDAGGVVRYRGSFESRDGLPQARIPYLQRAIEALANNRPIEQPITDAYGCDIRLDE